jgi:homoserine O-acetyltransferase
MEREIKRVTQGRYVLIPASEETGGHGTTSRAKWWKHHLEEFLQPRAHAAK